ncbi:LUD_dom domain-containing protein [Paraburkholderia sabiae]|uniref:lactate utilization protein n=1 Tax=Paraburkholderia sabiae TaxID=273251 RepID=UPI001CB2C6A9|nr:lactate utilization protein [Paraburkholderia sabiae]CAG9232832.1 LUD_dom domain-containing protein [Paraburkholderia sabiae]
MHASVVIDERDISHPINWVNEQRAHAVIAALRRRHFQAQYAADRAQALKAILALVANGATVFRADSVTLDQLEVVPALRARGSNRVMWPQEKDGNGRNIHGEYEANGDLYARLQREVFSADVYLTGANAVTMDGKIVSTDGGGNRVAPMIFGPGKVVIVMGVNKIVRNLEAAFDRIREFCAPVNVKRHLDMHHRSGYGELPCASSGICTDCDHPRRICNYTGILEGALPRFSGRINVILIGEELGM